jgi:acetyltransferase-like isoleucine patch superfamily enzyme
MAFPVKKAIYKILGALYDLPRKVSVYADTKRKSQHCVLHDGAQLYPQSRVYNNQPRDHIVIGAHSVVLARLETFGHGGRIDIGQHCFIGENTNIWSASHVTIGSRVLISHGVNIHDTNSHSISASRRHQHFLDIFGEGHPKELPDVPTKPITIEDDAWIGFGATVLKGVTIGRGAVVGACSLVTKDVPPFTVVAGSPAKAIGISQP